MGLHKAAAKLEMCDFTSCFRPCLLIWGDKYHMPNP